MNTKPPPFFDLNDADVEDGSKSLKSYFDARIDAAIEFYRHAKSTRHGIVRIGFRFFTVESPRSRIRQERPFYAYVRPLPSRKGTQPLWLLGRNVCFLPAETYVMFRLHGRKGNFKQIEVVQEFGRRGWATDMVRALLKAYPDVVWQNENLNENSGPLFQKLSARFPDRIAKVSCQADGTFEIAPPL